MANIPLLFTVATLVYITIFFSVYYVLGKPDLRSAEWIKRRKKPDFRPKIAGKFSKKDVIPLLAITLVYTLSTMLNLGNTVSPQSFHRFETGDDYITVELGVPAYVEEILYFTGLFRGKDKQAYLVELSSDGVEWAEQFREDSENRYSGMTQEHSETFRWLKANLLHDRPDDTRYIRIRQLYAPLELGELAISISDPQTGEKIRLNIEKDMSVSEGGQKLFDEQDIVPERYDILNSSHFDEIYHAYTAYQHVRGISPYEITHPPLGKLITSVGIAMFGMTPFGWRFMPALFGILMLPMLYLLLKWMFGKTSVAVCGTLLFAFEFMHFVQTRISTIDVYAVFFILAMFLFMYRFFASEPDEPFWSSVRPLIFAGLSFGIGTAAKWQCVYAGAGLLALFCIHMSRRARYSHERGRNFLPYFFGTMGVAFFSFIVIPGVIYIACYIPYALAIAPEGGFGSMGDFVNSVWGEFFRNQPYMYKYHSGLTTGHRFSARWYEWIIDWKPILYYRNHIAEAGTRATLWAFTNPLITWAGLGALAACFTGAIKRRSHTALFILIAYFSQLLPWVPITRATFPYHYFPSMLFLCVGMAYVFNRMLERDEKKGLRHMVAFTAVSVALFVLFYPVLSGTQAPDWYPQYLLRWLPNGNWIF